jgi:murein DD-endopeptidase MepM/ murein hydrolase activator NlpD
MRRDFVYFAVTFSFIATLPLSPENSSPLPMPFSLPAVSLCALLLIVIGLGGCDSTPRKDATTATRAAEGKATRDTADSALGKKTDSLLYGLNASVYDIDRSKVNRNDYLGAILHSYGVPYAKIDQLISEAEGVFDVTNIRSGNFYCAFQSDDSTNQECDYLVYEQDPVNYIVFQFKDSIDVYKGKREVRTKTRKTAAIIKQSLWQALEKQDASPALVMRLSEIYAWNVDFYRIDEGDRFKVIYEQRYVGDEYIGVGAIKAAYFQHRGEGYYAFPFKQNGEREFFNEKGQSLRKALLQAPLKFSRITSGYTKRRYHPVLQEYRSHKGTDYGAPRGTPIRSVGDGTVVAARYGKYNGRFVKIRHNSVYTTQYLHMSGIADGIRRGASVSQGEVIGYVGATGLANGSHLCYRFWKNGRQVDPYKQDIPAAEPLKPPYMEAFTAKYKPLKQELEALSYPGTPKAKLP